MMAFFLDRVFKFFASDRELFYRSQMRQKSRDKSEAIATRSF